MKVEDMYQEFTDKKEPSFVSLKRLLFWGFLYALSIFLILGIIKSPLLKNNWPIYFNNLAQTVCYFSVIFVCLKVKTITQSKLYALVFSYSLIFVLLNLSLFYSFTGRSFEFTGSDSAFYDDVANIMADMKIVQSIKWFLLGPKFGFDDLGFPLYLSFIYRAFDTPIMGRLINVVLNAGTAIFLYKIAKRFMAIRLAAISAVVFGTASYTVYYQSSGLKESLMLTLIIYSYLNYCRYVERPNIRHLCKCLFPAFALAFFRVPLVFFILISIGLSEILKNKKRISAVILGGIVLVSTLIGTIYFEEKLISYEQKYNTVLRERGDRPEDASLLLRGTAVGAGLFGPFPTIVPAYENEDTAMHAPSLVLKGFLSIYFIFALFFVLKYKDYSFAPLMLFALIHIISLTYLVHTLKMRNQFPAFPFIILGAFYTIGILSKHPEHTIIKKIINVCNICVVPVVFFFWNFLRL
jgi:hypothetical protein